MFGHSNEQNQYAQMDEQKIERREKRSGASLFVRWLGVLAVVVVVAETDRPRVIKDSLDFDSFLLFCGSRRVQRQSESEG